MCLRLIVSTQVFPFWLVNKDGWEAKLKREAGTAVSPSKDMTEA
jgi:hypothetical protein